MDLEFTSTLQTFSLQSYLFPVIKWGLLIYFAICIFMLFDRKTKQEDIKTRMWKKFQFANYELLPEMNPSEKREMLMTFDNTILNAELFKGKKNKLFENENAKLKKSAKKRVSFSFPGREQ